MHDTSFKDTNGDLIQCVVDTESQFAFMMRTKANGVTSLGVYYNGQLYQPVRGTQVLLSPFGAVKLADALNKAAEHK